MIETNEQIPNLMPIKQVIDNINKLLGYDADDAKPIKYWVAGGAITAAITGQKINDFDIFTPQPRELRAALKEAIGYSTFEHDFFANFWVENKKIQVISRYTPDSPQAIFNTFDFTINCGAYDGNTFTYHNRFWQDIATRRLMINELYFPLKTMERLTKYTGRGYKPCPHGLLRVARAINEAEIDWENPSQNDLEFYPDGTPRFMGVD